MQLVVSEVRIAEGHGQRKADERQVVGIEIERVRSGEVSSIEVLTPGKVDGVESAGHGPIVVISAGD